MSQSFSMIGWYILPGLATSVIQTIYYGLTIRAGDPKPAPESARHAVHRRHIKMAVVVIYLLYTIFEAYHDIRADPSYYEELGVPLDAGEREIRSRFRRVAAMHHPDKTGSDDDGFFFMHLKAVSDTLQHSAKRFAYERFGPSVLTWTECVTIREFVTRGFLLSILPHYSIAAATIYLLGLTGYMETAKLHRWLMLVGLCLFELHAVTRPEFPAVVRVVNAVATRLPPYTPLLPFQVVKLAQKLVLTLCIGIAQIGPLLAEQSAARRRAGPRDEKLLQLALDRLEVASGQLDTETTRMVALEMAPFKGDDMAVRNLRDKMREWLVQNTIRADPMVRDAMGTSLRRRRIDAPSGARGTR
ncbi:Chaperone protein DnaJ [Ophiocordyceps camponoti-floridani]|uniref:Chaperone protein DnaJ n=1 Tax=Ophiocordyceps camponoti-floridani TaxID=2030778 RepID=A0A8H4VBT8_9HYPO|nr:Chaperone protein DnaJ [Ophiocordyceps camponoti-floridani]